MLEFFVLNKKFIAVKHILSFPDQTIWINILNLTSIEF